MAGKHVLGLHTKDERNTAYTLARHEYNKAVNDPGRIDYASGYIQAILDLLQQEAPNESELVGVLFEMEEDLARRM